MPITDRVDLGHVQIHKKVVGDIAASAIKDISGVQLARFGLVGGICELFGYKNFPGTYVTIDQDGQISLEIRVEINYGINISSVSLQIQDKIQMAIEEALDFQLKEINVSIQAVVR